jgi:cyclomaltodextrinase
MHTPDWVRDTIFYQIFPDRFARGARLTKPDYLEAWDAAPTFRGYKGGDLYGIIEHLDHIQTLGATALYLTPIFQAAPHHRYNTHGYYQVDPLLGGTQALRTLLDVCHTRYEGHRCPTHPPGQPRPSARRGMNGPSRPSATFLWRIC